MFDAEEALFDGLVFTKDETKPDAKNLQEATRPIIEQSFVPSLNGWI